MVKRRSSEQVMYANFMALEAGKWFMLAGRSDYEKNVAFLKVLIDSGEHFEFDSAYRRFRRLEWGGSSFVRTIPYHKMTELPDGVRLETIPEGFKEKITVGKGKEITVTHDADKFGRYKPSYRVYKGDKLIAIEI